MLDNRSQTPSGSYSSDSGKLSDRPAVNADGSTAQLQLNNRDGDCGVFSCDDTRRYDSLLPEHMTLASRGHVALASSEINTGGRRHSSQQRNYIIQPQ